VRVSRTTRTSPPGRLAYSVSPFPWVRVPVLDSLFAVRHRLLMHALIEVDVTAARETLREYRQRTGRSISFTAFIIACMARAVAEHPEVQAYRRGRRQLMLFDDVDVCTLIEHDARDMAQGGGVSRQALPYVIRQANRKTVHAIHADIRGAQARGMGSRWELRSRRLSSYLPRPLRRLFWWWFTRYPGLQQRIGGTVCVSSVGMFGSGTGWGISSAIAYTLEIIVGGIVERPALVDGRLENRQFLCLTVSANHEVVDGAPLARFIRRLKELIAVGYGLDALPLTVPPDEEPADAGGMSPGSAR